MSDFNWCHGPSCHERHTQDRVRGVKGSKVLRTRKVTLNQWNRTSCYSKFWSNSCYINYIWGCHLLLPFYPNTIAIAIANPLVAELPLA